jgi:HEAT repeat protein
LRQLEEATVVINDVEDATWAWAIDDLRRRCARVRGSAIQVLGKIGDPRAVEALILALKDDSASVGLDAANALNRIGGTAAAEALKDIPSYWKLERNPP